MKYACFPHSRSRRNTFLRSACPLLAAALLANAQRVSAATQTYDATGTSGTATFGSNTWTTAATPTDFTNTSGTGDVAFTNGNGTIFGGTSTGTATVTLGSAITTSGMTINAAGYIFATGANTLTIGTGGITTTTGGGITTFTGIVADNGDATYTANGTDTVQFNSSFNSVGKTVFAGTGGGIFNFASTTAFNTGATNYVGVQGATVNVTAGTTTISPNVSNGFYVGSTGNAGQSSAFNVTGGTATISNNTQISIGDGYNFTGIAGDGTLSVGGGAATGTFTTGATTNTRAITLGGTNATGTVNLNTNGVFATNRAFAAGATGKGVINFSGGTLQATGTALAIPNTVTTNIADNGGVIDPNGFVVTIAANMTHGGTATTDGGLNIKSSATGTVGTVALTGILGFSGGLTFTTGGSLSGVNTYSGPTAINAFVDASTSGNVLGATGTGNGTTIGAAGTLRFRDTGNATIPEALTFGGGTFLTYNDPGTTTLSGAITLNANTTLSVSPQAQGSTTLVLSGGIADGATTGNSVVFSRLGAAVTASNDVVNITGASTYGGATAITDALNTNTGSFSVRVSGGGSLPAGTTLTLGGTAGGGVAAGSGRLILGDTTNGATTQTLAGLVTSGTGTKNAVVGGAATASTLTLNIATGTNTYAGLLGGAGTNENNLALTKSGAGTLVLSSANTYNGGTTVSTGMLTVSAGGALGTGSVTVGTGTTLTLNSTASKSTAIGDTATLNLNGTLTLTGTNGTVQEIVGILVVNGTTEPIGLYGSTTDTTPGITKLASIMGTGELSVTAVPEPSTWAMMLGGLGGLITLMARRRRKA